jgi:hypothetical protein
MITDKDKFELWVSFIPDYLYYFFEQNPELAAKLDFSISSLDVIYLTPPRFGHEN